MSSPRTGLHRHTCGRPLASRRGTSQAPPACPSSHLHLRCPMRTLCRTATLTDTAPSTTATRAIPASLHTFQGHPLSRRPRLFLRGLLGLLHRHHGRHTSGLLRRHHRHRCPPACHRHPSPTPCTPHPTQILSPCSSAKPPRLRQCRRHHHMSGRDRTWSDSFMQSIGFGQPRHHRRRPRQQMAHTRFTAGSPAPRTTLKVQPRN